MLLGLDSELSDATLNEMQSLACEDLPFDDGWYQVIPGRVPGAASILTLYRCIECFQTTYSGER